MANSTTSGPGEARRVRVHYETRSYGLAMAIVDELDEAHGMLDGIEVTADGPHGPADGLEVGNGVLTIGDGGVATLELIHGDGSPSFMVWDAAEVDWESLRAG